MTKMLRRPTERMPEWLARGSGSYPVAEGLSISEVERILEVRGWLEIREADHVAFRCDELQVPEWVG